MYGSFWMEIGRCLSCVSQWLWREGAMQKPVEISIHTFYVMMNYLELYFSSLSAAGDHGQDRTKGNIKDSA